MPKEIISKKERILQYFKDKRERESKERRKLFRNFKKRVERNKDEAVFNMSKISKYLANILQKFGEKKEKKISNFDKELAKINKETNDKKYIQMIIELLIGSGLLVTAIILLLIFLYKPNNDQINFVNTNNNNNNKSLADKFREYKDNAIKRNQKRHPSHYREIKGKNVYYNPVNNKYNIPEKKESKIIKKFETTNNMSFSDIETVGHYNSLAKITKEVMDDNTKNNRNENKRIIPSTPQSTPRRRKNPTTPPTVEINPTTPPRGRKTQIETPPTVAINPNRNRNRITNRKPPLNLDENSTNLPSTFASLENVVKSRIKKSRLKNLVLKNKTPPRNKQVKSRKSEEESPNNVAFFENYKTSDRITNKFNLLNEEVVNNLTF